MANTFDSNSQSPVSSSNPVECDFRDSTVQPNLATFPGIAIFLTVLGFNLAGDGLRDALDPTVSRASRTA